MKKIACVLLVALALQACDDGDLKFKTLNFNNENVQECNSLLYIINNKEVMILDIPESNFLQTPTEEGNPIIYTLTASDKLIYRLYSDNVTSSTLCSTIPASTPIVVDEYVASPGGKIQIITNIITDVNETTKSTKINYTHQIKLQNCQFTNGIQTNIYNEFLFGNYTSNSNTMSYSFTNSTNTCTNNIVYKNNTNQSLTLEFNTFNFPTTLGNTILNLDSDNKIISRLYTGGTLSNSIICDPTLPTSFELIEEWVATEGTVDITTTLINISGIDYYKHTIILNNCIYKKENKNYVHDQFAFGEYLVPY